jgi:hypothetical protein
MRADPDCRPPPTAWHASLARTSTSHPPQQQDTVHRELRPGPTRHVPRQQQQDEGKEDILSSATGPSTVRCSKDVTTHQHRPGARPGRPCPVPACSGQPLPGERRFSPPCRTEFFALHASGRRRRGRAETLRLRCGMPEDQRQRVVSCRRLLSER